jgi:hypothetical protein
MDHSAIYSICQMFPSAEQLLNSLPKEKREQSQYLQVAVLFQFCLEQFSEARP